MAVKRRRLARAEREESMLDAAGSAFARHGFHGASMDAIADAAGISKPMLYNYFGSKEGLYAAYVKRSGQALVETMARAVPGGQSSEAFAHALVGAGESLANWWLRHPSQPREELASLLMRL